METNITKGKWKVAQLNNSEIGKDGAILHVVSGKALYGNEICAMFQDRRKNKANAKLIADAGTTANKCGLFPSELLEQRNELLEALKSITYYWNTPNKGSLNEHVEHSLKLAEQAIKNATK